MTTDGITGSLYQIVDGVAFRVARTPRNIVVKFFEGTKSGFRTLLSATPQMYTGPNLRGWGWTTLTLQNERFRGENQERAGVAEGAGRPRRRRSQRPHA